MAFFPCVRFEDQIIMGMRGDMSQQKNWDISKKLEYAMKLNNELNEMYALISMLAHIAVTRKLKLIIENPYSNQHYLTRYWCIRPKVIDKDRTIRGDYYKKPTQYWFINCEPKHNFEWFGQTNREVFSIEKASRAAKCLNATNVTVARSMIAPEYANRFIREFILEGAKS